MRSRSFISALALLLLLAGCNRASNEDISAKPSAELLGNIAPSAIDTPSDAAAISPENASNAGVTLILARDVCQIPKADLDRIAQYYSAALGQDAKLKAAFVIGAKTGAAIHADTVKKGEVEQLKSVTCPELQKTLALLPPAKQG